MPKREKQPEFKSPCCGVVVEKETHKAGDKIFCSKCGSEVEPHLLIHKSYDKKQSDEIKAVFKRAQKE